VVIGWLVADPAPENPSRPPRWKRTHARNMTNHLRSENTGVYDFSMSLSAYTPFARNLVFLVNITVATNGCLAPSGFYGAVLQFGGFVIRFGFVIR
jgi:hypothetical protein